MIIHREIKQYLPDLFDIYKANRKRYKSHQAFMLYQVMLDTMRYWRHLQELEFHHLSEGAQCELYYYFTESLLHVHDAHLDLYWLIADLDGQPLFEGGRDPEVFWQKRPARRLGRMEWV